MRKITIEERAISLGRYIIETKDTVRSTAKKFGVSKSTVHKDVTLWNGLDKSTSKSLISYRRLYGFANWTNYS